MTSGEDIVETELMRLFFAEGARAPVEEIEDSLNESMLANIYAHGRRISRSHTDLARALLENDHSGGTFEVWWYEMADNPGREFLVRKALEHAARACGGPAGATEEAGARHVRPMCPDLTVPKLTENRGIELIKLVRQIVQSGLVFEGENEYYPKISEQFDAYEGIDRTNESGLPQHRGIRAMQAARVIEREEFVITFVAFVLRVHGLGPSDDHHLGVLCRKPVHPHNLRGRFASGRGIVSQTGLRLPRSNDGKSQHPTADHVPEYMDHCTTCGRIKEEVKELVEANEDLKFCQKCVKLDPPHRIPYCSRDCQVADFASHKLICGKLFRDLGLPFPGLLPAPATPPPSLPLQWQILQYKSQPSETYPKTLYHFRYFDQSTPGCTEEEYRKDKKAWLKKFRCYRIVATEPNTLFEQRLVRAFETRAYEDIQQFIRSVAGSGLMALKDYVKYIFLGLANEWSVHIDAIRHWDQEAACTLLEQLEKDIQPTEAEFGILKIEGCTGKESFRCSTSQ